MFDKTSTTKPPIKIEPQTQSLPQIYRSNLSLNILKHFFLISSSGIVVVILLILIGIWRTGGRFITTIEGFINAPVATPKIEKETLIIKQINGVSELTTSKFVMEAIVPTSQEWKLGNLVVGKTQLLYIAHGQVRAGINLEKLNPEDVKIHNNTLKIKLPPPEILDSKIDVNRSRVYDYDRGFLNLGPDVAPELQTLAQRETLKTIVQEACKQGILEDANNRANLAINQLFINSGYENIEIIPTAPTAKNCKL